MSTQGFCVGDVVIHPHNPCSEALDPLSVVGVVSSKSDNVITTIDGYGKEHTNTEGDLMLAAGYKDILEQFIAKGVALVGRVK